MNIPLNLTDDLCTPGYHIIDNFLDEETYQALRSIIQERQKGGLFKQGMMGKQLTQNTTVRNDHISWLDTDDETTALRSYFSAVKTLCETLNQSLFLGLTHYEAHYAVYPPGSFYKKHIDQFSTNQDRRISCVYYLNDHWEDAFGGQLLLYDKLDRPLANVMPLGNRFICFNSDLPHEVCTAFAARYSIAAWLKVRPLSLVA